MSVSHANKLQVFIMKFFVPTYSTSLSLQNQQCV